MAIDTPQPIEVRKLTLDDVLEMCEADIIKDWERVELVDGVLVTMSPEGIPHAAVITRLTRLFTDVYDAPIEVRVNLTRPLSGPYHFRVPDLLVTQPVAEMRWAEPAEVILAVEVANTSTVIDLGAKAHEYAQWGVPVYWVIDLPSQSVIVHERPVGDRYASVSRRAGTDPVTFPRIGRVVSATELLRLPTP